MAESVKRRGAGSIVEREPGVWTLRAWDPVNKRRTNVTFRGSERGAEQALARHVADVSRTTKVIQKVKKEKVHRYTVEDAFRAWAGKGDLEGQSLEHARFSLRFFGIGAMHLDELTEDFLRDLIGRLVRHGGRCPCRDRSYCQRPCPRGKGLAKSTVIRYYNDLRAALQYATDELRWLDNNPARRVKPKTKGKRQEAKKPRSPSTDEILLVLEAARQDNPRLYVCLFLAAAIGARAGEQCGLRWAQVDLDAGEVLIDRTIALQLDSWDESAYWGEKPYPKNDEPRTVAIDPAVVAMLRGHRQFCEQRAAETGVVLGADAYLFSRYPDCSDPWRVNSLGNMFRKICDDLGIKDIRLHDLRRYFATQLIRAGVDLGRVQHAGGWNDSRMLLGIYNDTVKEADREAAAVMSGLLAPKPKLTLVVDAG